MGFSVIDDSTNNDILFPTINGEKKGTGHDPSQYVPEMFAPPSDMKIIPRNEWSARIKELEELKARLSDYRTWASLDQNGQGYCWAYSTTACVMLLRAIHNLPHVRLSAHAIGCMVKGFRDEGGWCGLSAKFHRERGCPTVEHWGEKSMSRSNDKPETWTNAALHKITEEWMDLRKADYDHELTFDQVATCLLNGIPCALDFSWWGHSVCGMDLVEVERGSYGIRILNSWSDQWEDRGTSVLRGQKAIPDGAVALRVTNASLV